MVKCQGVCVFFYVDAFVLAMYRCSLDYLMLSQYCAFTWRMYHLGCNGMKQYEIEPSYGIFIFIFWNYIAKIWNDDGVMPKLESITKHSALHQRADELRLMVELGVKAWGTSLHGGPRNSLDDVAVVQIWCWKAPCS